VPDEDRSHPDRRVAAEKLANIGVEAIRKRDLPYGDMSLDDFCKNVDEICEQADLPTCTRAEVAALRLYTGPAYKRINAALRAKNISPWATTYVAERKKNEPLPLRRLRLVVCTGLRASTLVFSSSRCSPSG
jgi:hypothetical protein